MADVDPVNWLLLVSLLVILIVTSAFLFYWNRLLASVFAFGIRVYTWRKHNAYIVIGSLQISPLAGRIAFRDVEYHSSNLSIRALHGHVTWRYWLFRVRQNNDETSQNVKRAHLPCRIAVTAEGVEAFVFNRTPAYDAIVERMKKHERENVESKTSSADSLQKPPAEPSGLRTRWRRARQKTVADAASQPSNGLHDVRPLAAASDLPYTLKPVNKPIKDGVDWFRESLPLEIRIVTGSILLGSDATPMVLVGDFKRADGTLRVTDSRSVCDIYRMEADLTFEKPHVLMRTNVDYSGSLLAHGRKTYDELLKQDRDIARNPPSTISTFAGFHALAKRYAFLYNPKFSSPPVVGLPQDKVWKGLARYRQPENSHQRPPKREEREYAKKTTLLVSERLDVLYYSDTPGQVPFPTELLSQDEADEFGNVDLPPEYGIDITIYGGDVTYGPWADRQRDALQRAFAPSIFFDSEPKQRLQPGDTRIHSALVLNILLERDTKLIIPTREPSKDWLFDNMGNNVERKYGWLEIVAGANSTIVYTQSQFATTHGYDAMLVLNLDSLEIASSVAYQSFVKAKSCKLSMTMPTPLRWDAQRDWGLDISVDSPDITLLRDHTTLISDLSRDWSSGVTGDFHHFVPNHYNFRISLVNYAVHLFVNDFNIVDDPKSRESNAFMDVYGPRLGAYVAVATTRYRPEFSVVPFSIDGNDARVELSLPAWDTHRSFDSPDPIEIGKIGHIKATGSYRYYSTPSPEHQETMRLHLEGSKVIFKSMGWVLRRLFCIKDNYFGGFTQYSNLNEFLEKFDHDPRSVGDPVKEKYRPGRSDPYAVYVTMDVVDSMILLPDEIYGCTRGLVMPVPQLQMNLKSIEHFMELSLDALPTYIIAEDDFEAVYTTGEAPISDPQDVIFIEGINLKAIRLFGPQPRATTYLCLWEAVVPRISAFVTLGTVDTILHAIRAVVFNFEDIDNAPTATYIIKSPPDVTFFKFTTDHVATTLSSSDSVITCELPLGMNLDTSTLASRTCKSRLGLVLPALNVGAFRRGSDDTGVSAAQLSTELAFDMYKAPHRWQDAANRQQAFIRKEDSLTKRIWYMYSQADAGTSTQHKNGIFLPIPYSLEDDSEISSDEDLSVSAPLRTQIARSSSPDDSEGPHDASHPRRPKRRSRLASMISLSEDFSDESDTSTVPSSYSPGISATTGGHDMASALALRLQGNRAFRSSLPGIQQIPLAHSEGDALFGSTAVDHGKVMSVLCQNMRVKLRPAIMQVVSDVLAASQSLKVRPDLALDDLLFYHTEAIPKVGRTPEPLVLNIRFPLSSLAIISDGPEASSVDVDLQQLTVQLLQQPRGSEQDNATGLSANLEQMSLAVLALHPQIPTLRQATKPPVLSPDGWPMLQMTANTINLNGHRNRENSSLTVGANSVDVHAVTPAVSVVQAVIQPFLSSMEGLKSTTARSSTEANLLYEITANAVQNSGESAVPDFMTEFTYGLHIQDQRNIRRDIGWIMLARLRHWLRVIPRQSPEPQDLAESAAFVSRELAALDYETGGREHVVRQLEFMRRAFGQINNVESTPGGSHKSGLTIVVFVEKFGLQHHGRLLEADKIVTSWLNVKTVSFGWNRSHLNKKGQPATHLRVVTAVESLDVRLFNSLLFALHRLMSMPGGTPNPAASIPAKKPKSYTFALSTSLGQGEANLIGGGVRLRLHLSGGTNNVIGKKITRDDDQEDTGRKSVQLVFDQVDLSLLQPVRGRDLECLPQDRLAVLCRADQLRIVTEEQIASTPARADSRILLGARDLRIETHPLPNNFLDFASSWRQEYYPHFKPVIDDVQTLISTRSTRVVKPKAIPKRTVFDMVLSSAFVQMRAAPQLFVRWVMGRVYLNVEDDSQHYRFGLRLEPQLVGAHLEETVLQPDGKKSRSKKHDSSQLRLPSLDVLGSYDAGLQQKLVASVNVGFFTGTLKPVILDRLLSLHQRLAGEMMKVVKQYRHSIESAIKDRHQKRASAQSDHSKTKVRLHLRITIAGVRFGLRADNVNTTLLFEALNLHGSASNHTGDDADLRWNAKVQHMGLSLGHLGHEPLSESEQPLRKHRSAYMVGDIEIDERPDEDVKASRLTLNLRQVHTVMQVAALSEISDLIQSWSSDIHVLYDHKAEQVHQVRKQTTQILKRLEANDKESKPVASWFATRWLRIRVSGFGIAFPLIDESTLGVQDVELSSMPALLFSIKDVDFSNRRNETARFLVENMALQFVDRFDQSQSGHFEQGAVICDNQMTLPSIVCEAQMSTSVELWTLTAHSSATNFRLSLAPTVADAIFRLISLYDHGKHRIIELERQYRSELAKQIPAESVAAKYDVEEAPQSARPTQQFLIRLSFTFNSGTLIFNRLSSRRSTAMHTEWVRGRRVDTTDTFILPTVSAWVDYTSASHSASDPSRIEGDAQLVLNAAVHASENTLHPTILPFFIDIAERIENQNKIRKSSPINPTRPSITPTFLSQDPLPPHSEPGRRPQLPATHSQPSISATHDDPADTMTTVSTSTSSLAMLSRSTGKLRIRVTLRIDRSTLRFDCRPDSEAFLTLRWDSGGFIATTTVGGDNFVTVAGSISGVTSELGHRLINDPDRNCVIAGAKDLAFSVSYLRSTEQHLSGLSVVFETQISAQFRLDSFSLFLMFMAIWVDNIPGLKRLGQPPAEAVPNAAHVAAVPKLPIVALFRFKTVVFDADLAVTRAKLQLTPIVLRSLSNGERLELEVNAGLTHIEATGDISGEVRSESLRFSTIRRSSRASNYLAATMLSLKIEGGNLMASLFLRQTKNIVRMRLAPSTVTLADDWSTGKSEGDSQVALAFTVNAGRLEGVLRLFDLPDLAQLVYSISDKVINQRRDALGRSKEFAAREQRRLLEPAPVVAAIAQTARKAGLSASSSNSLRISQTMQFDLAGIDVGTFKDDAEDGHAADFYRFIVGRVKADLKRSRTKEDFPHRDLDLLVEYVRWDTSDGQRVTRYEQPTITPRQLLDLSARYGRREVASLPRMVRRAAVRLNIADAQTLTMDSVQLPAPPTLDFDYDLSWGDTEGDFAILPNFLESAFQAFKKLDADLKLVRGNKEHNEKGMKRAPNFAGFEGDEPQYEEDDTLVFRRRGGDLSKIPIPRFKLLGEATTEAARLVPRLKAMSNELPALSHRFVTLQLEEGMDLLMKLYEKQLPDERE